MALLGKSYPYDGKYTQKNVIRMATKRHPKKRKAEKYTSSCMPAGPEVYQFDNPTLMGRLTNTTDLFQTYTIDGATITLPDEWADNGMVQVINRVNFPIPAGGPFTLFAPTNATFDTLPEGGLDGLLADPEALGQVLFGHVAPSTVFAAGIVSGTLQSAAGDNLVIVGNPVAESLPVLQLPNLHDLQYASNAENANKLISFVGLLLKIERLQPTASNRPTTKLTIASDDLTAVAQMMLWEKPDKKYDVSILERYAIVNANINIFRNSTNLVPSLIVPTKLISLGRHPALPQRQVIRIPNPTIVRDEGVFINGQMVSINPNFADILLMPEEELAILKEASYTAVISRLVIHGIDIDTTLEDLEAPPLSEEDVESDP
ncbi:uncharacterized protein LOC136042492 [Artemia franciscana]|uniref:uncharacterized protein LOC136042492 n=1 Tax=Artemia franciscana TaxID=6661 RepID=UPI0032DB3DA2